MNNNLYNNVREGGLRNRIVFSLILSLVVVFTSLAGTAFACTNGSQMSLAEFINDRNAGRIHGSVSISGSTANGTIVNDSDCAMPATLSSYNKLDGSYANQTTYQQVSINIPAHSTGNASVGIPNCSSQIDFYYGTYYSHSADGIDQMDLAYTHNDGPYCTQETNVVASCSINPASVQLGSSATLTATASGGTGSYAYSWIGTDGLSGASSTISETYPSAGLKVATVTVTSGGQSATANCSTTVSTPTPNLSASCSASPASVQLGGATTWTATASGGTGAYTYSWTGTEGLSGASNTVSQTYPSAGSKVATVTVTSGGQSATANCSATVTSPSSPNLAVSCTSSPSSVTSGQAATFIATATGGSGAYTYSWSGVCTGVGSTCNNNISGSGTQSATVLVTSGSQTATANCSVSVGQSCTPNYNQRCIGTSMYWYDSCGAQGSYVGTCGNTCTPNYTQRCTGTSMYWYDSCGAQGSYIGTCGNTCTPNYTQRCTGNSMYWYDSCGAQGSYIGTCGQTYTNASLNMTKTVRDLTMGTAFSSSTYANPSDMLMYMITLQASGNQDVQNVVVRDTLPNNLIYNNHLVVARNNNSYNNYSGDIVYGLNLNTIPSGQAVTVTYQAQVASALNFPYGTTTLNNLVSATASNASVPTSTASAIITKSTVLGASTVSTGLTNNFWVDSFFLPLLIALIGIWMLRSGVFFGIEKWFDNRKKIRRGYKAEKELSSRIETIKKFGGR